jgi:hypothetical protein
MFEKKPEATNGATPTPAPEAAVKKSKDKEVVTLKELCKEMKIDPTDARVKLRAAGKKLRHTPGKAWEWGRGSPVIKEVKAILKSEVSDDRLLVAMVAQVGDERARASGTGSIARPLFVRYPRLD